MKYLAIILFLIGCNSQNDFTSFLQSNELEKAQYIVLNRPDTLGNYHQIEYIGNWKHMSNGGSYANRNIDTARFEFWGYGVQIRTELMHHHKVYQVLIDGEFIESVNVKNPVNTTHNLTYSNMGLVTGNHVLELVPDGGYFVLNTLTIHYYVDPTPELPCDTIYIPSDTVMVYDTVYISSATIYKTIFLQPKVFIEADSIIYVLE